MAKITFGLVLLALYLITKLNGVTRVGATFCEVPSRSFRGVCLGDSNCARICEKEGFLSGHCKLGILLIKCVCVKDCGGTPSTPPPPDSPPQPPPPPGGCPMPPIIPPPPQIPPVSPPPPPPGGCPIPPVVPSPPPKPPVSPPPQPPPCGCPNPPFVLPVTPCPDPLNHRVVV